MVKPPAGYTLTEMMVVIAILGIISSTSALVMKKTFETQSMADALASIQQGAFTSFDVISKLLRQSSASSVVIDRFDANQPPWSRIAFSNPSTGRSFTFYQKGQTLYYGNNPTMKNLRALTFTYPNTASPSVVSVSMTFEKTTGSGRSKAIQLFIQNVRIQNN